MAILPTLAVAAIALVCWRVSVFVNNKRFERFAREHQCEHANHLPQSRYGAVKRVWRLLNSRKSGEDIIDDIIGPDFVQAPTFAAKQFTGSTAIATCDPENLQAVLATQFDDFVEGQLRHQALAPVFGRSIFNSDGMLDL